MATWRSTTSAGMDHRGGPDERLTVHASTSELPWLAADALGRVHVVWDDARNGTHQVYYKCFDGEWSADVAITDSADGPWQACVATDPLSNVHVIWVESTTTVNTNVFYRCRDANGWGPVTRLSTGSNHAFRERIACDIRGWVHVVWQDTRDGNLEIYHRVWRDGAWGPEERLTEDPMDSQRPAIATDLTGRIHVVWADDWTSDSEMYYKAWDEETGWSAASQLTECAGASGYPSITTDGENRVHVVWTDARDGNSEIYYKSGDGGIWTPDERLTHDSAGSGRPSLIVDSRGLLHVFWYDQRDGNEEIYDKQGISPSDVAQQETLPGEVRVDCAPNPFRGQVRLTFEGPQADRIQLLIQDAGGRRIRRFSEDGPSQTRYINWDGRDDSGIPVGSGVYFWHVIDSSGDGGRSGSFVKIR